MDVGVSECSVVVILVVIKGKVVVLVEQVVLEVEIAALAVAVKRIQNIYHGTVMRLAFTTSGVVGSQTNSFYTRLAEVMLEKQQARSYI